MNIFTLRKQPNITSIMLMIMVISASCTKSEPDSIQEIHGGSTFASAVHGSSTFASAVYESRIINWDNRLNDAYTVEEAVEDFGNIVYGWNDTRIHNSEGTCRVKLLKNALSGDGGIISKIDVPDGSEYEIQFDVKYHSQFDWSKGGKVGFGFCIGDGFSGCNPAWSGTGGSFRVVWFQDSGRVYLQPYAYYKDQPETCGNKFNKTYPATGSIIKGRWYTVKLYAKSNTGSNTNGRIKLVINETIVLDQAIRWTTSDAKRLITSIYFSTFRGGSQAYWKSTTDGLIYFDNLSWRKLAN